MAVGLVLDEETNVNVTIAKSIPAKALHRVILPLAFVCLTILGHKSASAMFQAIYDLTFVVAATIFVDFLKIWTLFGFL